MQEFCCKQKNHIMHIQVLIKMDDITDLKTESNIGQNEKQLQTLRVKSTLSLSLSLSLTQEFYCCRQKIILYTSNSKF